MSRRVVVVGGGIAGLAAAHELADRDGVEVVVVEASDRLGGKIHTAPFAGVPLDTGPDAFLARRPEAVALCTELGLAGDLVAPVVGAALVWTRGRLRGLPAGSVLGVPTRLGPVARSGTLSPLGLARLAVEPLLPGRALGAGEDEAVGALVRRRLGAEAAAVLVDPLVGGINAGDTRRLSIEAVTPQLAAAARRSRSLVWGARAVVPAPAPGRPPPVFLTPVAGVGALVATLTARLERAGVVLRTGVTVTGLRRAGAGYRVDLDDGAIDADGVVVAVPAFVAAPLLDGLAPAPASALAAVDHASVSLVALAYPADAVPRRLDASGFLVPRREGRLMTACSWASSKWAHLARPGQVILRVSAGRAGDARAGAMDDTDLVAGLRRDLAATMGIRGEPSEVRVTRWPRGFPQYAPGHLDRMAAVRAELAERTPGVALAGAALGGIGIPACIGSGRRAAHLALPSR